jgi:hypothetical protein
LHLATAHRIEQLVHPPMRCPPMKICGIVGANLARSTARTFTPISSCWNATESRSTLSYSIPRRANNLRTAQQNSHHSSANSTTGFVAHDLRDEGFGARVERFFDRGRRQRGHGATGGGVARSKR